MNQETYRYTLKRTGKNSNYLGNCEICGKHCSEVFHQIEEQAYNKDKIDAEQGFNGIGWTRYNCHDYFGHELCLKAKQHN